LRILSFLGINVAGIKKLDKVFLPVIYGIKLFDYPEKRRAGNEKSEGFYTN
jgi:hypothetical protein